MKRPAGLKVAAQKKAIPKLKAVAKIIGDLSHNVECKEQGRNTKMSINLSSSRSDPWLEKAMLL
jgi:hypothetical protein